MQFTRLAHLFASSRIGGQEHLAKATVDSKQAGNRASEIQGRSTKSTKHVPLADLGLHYRVQWPGIFRVDQVRCCLRAPW